MNRLTAISRRFLPAPSPGKLGTFIGVFTPSILTILGVILFLRAGWVVGNVGILGAVVIVIIANAVTFATALSVGTVATNMHVGAGGAYYIISRSLGVEIGAAIGIPLFLAQAFSVTLYAFGLAESFQLIWPALPMRPTATITVLVVALLAARGADLALRMQLPIMGGIVLALFALGIGVLQNLQNTVELASEPSTLGFWPVFAVFFPAVTGIMAGISLSGDLDNPQRSIPRGSIAAVLVGFAVYLGVVVALGLAATREELLNDNLIWFTLAGGFGFLIFPGLWGAIFSSAVGSVLGAPRTLEAMVDDRVLPRFIGKRIPRIDGPGVPLLISVAVALGAVMLGDLNAVAPVLTMFFLTTYGMVNLVAGIERLSGDPSFRPSLRIPSWISLAGALGCFWVMFLISPLALAVAVVVEVGVYLIMRRRALAAPWGDLRRGALMALVRSTVLQLRRLPEDPRNWRPNVLLFAGNPRKRASLVRFASWLVQDRGILTVSDLQVGRLEELGSSVREKTDTLNRDLDEMGVVAFGEVDIVDDFINGVVSVAQANGIAGISSNTVMFGWSEKQDRQTEVLRIIERLATIGISSVICNPRPFSSRQRRHIVVWWGGLQNNGDMLALFAHLISLNPEWRNAQITLKSIATSSMMRQRNQTLLERVISSARIDARIEILHKPDDISISELIFQESQNADVVLMGVRTTEKGEEEAYARRIEELAAGLPSALFIRSAGVFRGRLLGEQPDSLNGSRLPSDT